MNFEIKSIPFSIIKKPRACILLIVQYPSLVLCNKFLLEKPNCLSFILKTNLNRYLCYSWRTYRLRSLI